MLRVGVLVSGRGSNLEALLNACAEPGFPAQVVLVGCNRAAAPAVGIAKRHGVPVVVADRATYHVRAERQQVILREMAQAEVQLVVLAGFDEILGHEFLQAFAGRMLNTHPSLLPAFGRTMHAVQEALDHGVKVTGCTVHLVTDEVDGGPIVFQRCVEVLDDDDAERLHARIRAAEHTLVPAAVRAFAEGRVRIEGHRARVVP